jgi:hypothetical protein
MSDMSRISVILSEILQGNHQFFDNESHEDIFDHNANLAGSSMQFSVVFLYPEHGQTDYIKELHEHTRLIAAVSAGSKSVDFVYFRWQSQNPV